ncbi:MAG: hypothetical protein CVU86_08275 [Firmicutes bacterium HGW-Firmicutes-11]|jgi:DNA/RNA-binding domain of Phe-tRNA-synthetase-like protein|nr:MAG: hypothetical protein CVU86_08275 [Firmicutes bacterium HGW-Firmicutes-11]
MKRFQIDEGFWELFPEAKIGVVIASGIDNQTYDLSAYETLLWEAQRDAQCFLGESEFSANPAVAVWREAFQKFKTKKGARSSIESLLKRVQSEKPIGTINPLVDIYNSISLRFGLPCGGEDVDAIVGDLRLTMAEGGEDFIPLGEEESSPPYEGELVYKDDAGAVCRCWNWREAKRTMLSETTTNAFLCIESVDPAREADFHTAVSELAHLVSTRLGGSSRFYVLDKTSALKEDPWISLEA